MKSKVTDAYGFYQKLNYNCPNDEKSGSGKGACGGEKEDAPQADIGKLKEIADQKQKEYESFAKELKEKYPKREDMQALPVKKQDELEKRFNTLYADAKKARADISDAERGAEKGRVTKITDSWMKKYPSTGSEGERKAKAIYENS